MRLKDLYLREEGARRAVGSIEVDVDVVAVGGSGKSEGSLARRERMSCEEGRGCLLGPVPLVLRVWEEADPFGPSVRRREGEAEGGPLGGVWAERE